MTKIQILLGASARAAEREVKAKKILNAILVTATWAMVKLFLNLIVESAVVPVVKRESHVKNKSL